MKWCQRCGQQLKPVLPGKSCTQCGWVRPLVVPRRTKKQTSIFAPLMDMHRRHTAKGKDETQDEG